jgi:N-acetylmuramoyl-L-alanine amidase
MTITWKGSPNKNDSSYRKPIDRVVLHWFGTGDIYSANARFQNDASDVSAHYGVSDGLIYQWVKEEEVAWHAGDFPMNQRSIGIEHDATTTKNASELTYQTAGQLLREICNRHNIPLDREHILKHSEVKPTQCPGTLDVDKIIAIARGEDMLDKDIETAVEEQFKLKEIPRYNKYWTYEELINDWVNMYKELVYNTEEKDKYKAEARDLREVTQSQAESISASTKEIESLNQAKKDLEFEISQLQAQFSDVSRERDSLADACKSFEIVISKNKDRIAELEAKLISQNPLKTYSSKDLLAEVVTRFVNIFKGGAVA